jgi:hypothetical protein
MVPALNGYHVHSANPYRLDLLTKNQTNDHECKVDGPGASKHQNEIRGTLKRMSQLPSPEAKRYYIPLAPALPTFGDERAIGACPQPATNKMLIAPEATA